MSFDKFYLKHFYLTQFIIPNHLELIKMSISFKNYF